MHQEINYSKIADEAVRRAKALNDIKAYLGEDTFNNVNNGAKHDRDNGGLSRKFFIASLEMMAGIEGYPAEVWADDLKLT